MVLPLAAGAFWRRPRMEPRPLFLFDPGRRIQHGIALRSWQAAPESYLSLIHSPETGSPTQRGPRRVSFVMMTLESLRNSTVISQYQAFLSCAWTFVFSESLIRSTFFEFSPAGVR